MPLVLAFMLDRPAEVWLKTEPSGQPSEKLLLLATLDPTVLAQVPSGGGVLLTLGGNPTSLDGAAGLVDTGSVTVEIVNEEKLLALWDEFIPKAVPADGPSHYTTVFATKGVRNGPVWSRKGWPVGQLASGIFEMPFKDRSCETGKEPRCPSQPACLLPTMSGEG
ncbi:MAG: hypothetical protein ACR2ME_07180 [Acidimicrobiia bacterium]